MEQNKNLINESHFQGSDNMDTNALALRIVVLLLRVPLEDVEFVTLKSVVTFRSSEP